MEKEVWRTIKAYITYKCENCGLTSKDRDIIELCEAKHIGLTNLDEARKYNELIKEFNDASARLTNACNNDLLDKQDQALTKLIEFEKSHGIKKKEISEIEKRTKIHPI